MVSAIAARVGTAAGGRPADDPISRGFGAPAPEDEPRLAEDTRVGDYVIRGLLGEGAMGQIYLAQDTRLGRRVALKLIKRSVMQGDGADRFLEEARATASFNHPNIVTLHAVGEHDGRPYLALEYIDGESLRAQLAAGPLPVPEALRCIREVAEAIAEAHRRGVVHADLKPDNVVISRDGRVRVVDFGLARLAGAAHNHGSGTPAYMAPERWHGAPPDGAIDVWALGIMLHELVTGDRPIPDTAIFGLAFSSSGPALASLPAAPWASIVRDCLQRDPAARPTAEELVRRIAALSGPREAPAAADPRCPFPGLAPFSRDHAADHFGRRARLDVLVDQLRGRALIPVVGPPGAGKTSFIRAGLLPRLDEGGRWIALRVCPGASPLGALAAALALPDRPAAELAEALRRDPDRLASCLRDVASHHGARVLLFVDQLEELFAGEAPAAPEVETDEASGARPRAADALAFCDLLGRAASAAEPWRIVLAMRDHVFDRLVVVPPLRPHLGGVMRLPAPSAADLRAAVVGPLASAGYEPDEPALVARIVRDVEGQPACLSLLQLVCQALWERRAPGKRRILTVEYEAMGGAAGALAGHARRFMAELAPGEARIARTLLLALFDPGGARRPRRRGELLGLVPARAREVAGRLLDRLLEHHLLVEQHPAGTLELGHDALATAWPELARWLDQTHDARAALAALEEAAFAWHRGGRRDDAAWSGAALAELARRVDARQLSLPPISRAFLDASLRRDRRLRRRRRWLAIAAGAVALIAAVVSLTLAQREALPRLAPFSTSVEVHADRSIYDDMEPPREPAATGARASFAREYAPPPTSHDRHARDRATRAP